MKKLALIIAALAVASSALAQQQASTPTPALSEAQIQAALTEQALLQKWNGMVAEWYIAIGQLFNTNPYILNKLLDQTLEQIGRGQRTIKDDIERVRLEAKLRGQPEPHVASDDVYQWYRHQGAEAASAAMRRATKTLQDAYGTLLPKKGGRK